MVTPTPSEEEVGAMGVKALKELIGSLGGSTTGCLEKADLVARALEVVRAQSQGGGAAQARGGGAGSSGGCGCHDREDGHRAHAPQSGTFDFEHSMAVGPLGCNCTILGDTTTGEALVCDPGGDLDKILAVLDAHNLHNLVEIVITHAHFDHFLAAGELRAARGGRLALHKDDMQLWEMLPLQCTFFGVQVPAAQTKPPTVDHHFADGEGIALGGTVLHVPGHSPGSCGFYFKARGLLLSGDCLFRRSVGRTDLWGGSRGDLVESIRTKFYTLPEDTRVITGHGPQTAIGDEMRSNSTVRAR
jgi:hydroxyacylglutathione hydrolase